MKAIETTVALGMAEAEARIRAALAEQGFGVLTEIDVAATLKAKLGVERTPMKILGACNPHLAHEALAHDHTISLLLPCNVVLEDTGSGTWVAAVDPHDLLAEPELCALADQAAARLQAAIDKVAAGA